MSELLDTFNLWSGNSDSIRSPHLRSFKDFDTAEQFATLSDDRELKSLISTVKRHNSKIPTLVARIKQATVDHPTQAQVHLTPAHKSKGLEWDNVRLTDDYMTLLDKFKKPRKLTHEEEEDVNILYVAATRAKHSLQPFPEMAELLSTHKKQSELNARSQRMPDWARPVTGLTPRR